MKPVEPRARESGGGGKQPALDDHELKKAEQEEELTASITYEVIRRAGRDELRRPSSALFWSGLAAGLSMGFTMLTEAILRLHLPEAEWTPLISSFGYSIGFLLVILGKQQLFTENTLTAVIPVLARGIPHAFRNMLRLWGVVLLANLGGTLLFALVLSSDLLFDPATMHEFDRMAGEALAKGGALRTFLLAIFAGWLIALMVWMLPAAEQLAALVIVVITWLVGVSGFPHIIAGSVEVFYAGFNQLAPWSMVMATFLLPTLLGNTLGGVALVAGLAHAQVASGPQREPGE